MFPKYSMQDENCLIFRKNQHQISYFKGERNMKYPHLFQPIQIGDTLFRNRIFSAPTGHPDITREGSFSEDAAVYYERKAQGGAAAITLGEAIVDSKYGKRHPFQASLDTRNSLHTLSAIADKINRHGAIASIELQHSGMKTTPGIETPYFGKGSEIIYGPSKYEYEGHPVEEMPEEIIWEVIDKFANAALFAKNSGFGMVTIHAGHGWLLNQFMNPRINRREDRWGGNEENRARIAVEICDAIHKKCGSGFPVEVRISTSEIIEGGYGTDEGIAFARQLEGHANIIHCSVGCGMGLPFSARTFSLTHPCMFKEDGVNVKYAAEVKKYIHNTPVATVGALSDPQMMEDIISSGRADIVEMARGLICDPDLPQKARDGRDEDIVHCMRCFSCFSNLKERGEFWCALNTETNRERSFARDMTNVVKKQKVLVIGGGIGGMRAASEACKNGHEVILCEKTDRLGGHILCEENVPFKKHLKEYIEQQIRQLKSMPVEIRMNTEVTPEMARAIGADAIVAALGARPVKPKIAGIDGENVLLADMAYIEPEKVGSTAVILGGGFVGAELAIYLKSLGKDVRVVEMAEKQNTGKNSLHGDAVRIKMREENIPIHFSTKAMEITPDGVWCDTPDGKLFYEAETVIYAVGQKSLAEEAMAFYDCATYYYPVGDCIRPGTIADANLQAKSVGRDIGRF